MCWPMVHYRVTTLSERRQKAVHKHRQLTSFGVRHAQHILEPRNWTETRSLQVTNTQGCHMIGHEPEFSPMPVASGAGTNLKVGGHQKFLSCPPLFRLYKHN